MTGSLYHPIRIGSLELKGNLFLAPMAGYTDRVYRSLCLKNGASLAYTEMVSAEGAYRSGEGTLELMVRGEGEEHLAVQLFMPDADTAARSLENVLRYKPDLIDVNCGCPVPKVIKTGCGSALLREPRKIGEIAAALCRGVKGMGKDGSDIPVSVKIRAGWDMNSINYLETSESAFNAGACAVCMHTRTRSQLYMPYANPALLTDLKRHFPDRVIIASGDLFTSYDIVRVLRETGADAASVARGAIGNPFVFEQAKALIRECEERNLSDEEMCEWEKEGRFTAGAVSIEQKKKAISDHLTGLCGIMTEEKACREMRKHVCMYIKGIPGGNKVKSVITQARCKDDYVNALSLL